jgi:hypothetical protein
LPDLATFACSESDSSGTSIDPQVLVSLRRSDGRVAVTAGDVVQRRPTFSIFVANVRQSQWTVREPMAADSLSTLVLFDGHAITLFEGVPSSVPARCRAYGNGNDEQSGSDARVQQIACHAASSRDL